MSPRWLPGHRIAPVPARPPADRFWEKVQIEAPDKCSLWTASTMNTGYGQFFFRGSMHKAHRVAWTLTSGEIPEGLYVCHRCDCKTCVNPAHLFLGTASDNLTDCVAKKRIARGDRSGPRLHPDRMPRGENVKSAKLTEDVVRQIRQAYEDGTSQQALADEHGLHRVTVARVVNGQTWRHVK